MLRHRLVAAWTICFAWHVAEHIVCATLSLSPSSSLTPSVASCLALCLPRSICNTQRQTRNRDRQHSLTRIAAYALASSSSCCSACQLLWQHPSHFVSSFPLSLSLSRLLFSPACHNIVDVGLSPPRLPFPLPTAQPPATALRSIWFLANWFSDFRRKSQQHARGATKVAREGGGASTRCSLNTLWHLLCVLCAFRLSCLVGSQPDKTMKQSQTQSKSLSTSPSASLRLSLSYTEGREGTPYLTLTR